MSTRETVGWALVALSAVFAVSAAWVKGGVFEALTAASTACGAAAAMWGYTNKPPVPPAPAGSRNESRSGQ